mmetsp:Transcript_16169/g.19205  ORF Transcript_16169/g.19205 Transcript_16169/m.19205 type:complete len:200 (+) Transcript_16169:937-1536(+)
MALDTGGNDQNLLGGDVVHHELLHGAGVDVADVVLETEAGHAESLVAVGSSQEQVLIVREGIVLAQVLVQVVALLVLGAGDVGSEDGAGFEGAVNHHLEHVGDIVLDAVGLEIGALLIVLHLEVATAHLDHAVVDGLVGVLESLEVGVLEGEERARILHALVTGAHVHEHAHVDSAREGLALGKHGETVAQIRHVVFGL